MDIMKFDCGPLDTMCYLLIDGEDAILIDAAPGSFTAISDALAQKKVNLQAVLLTHGHWDHSTDARKFQREMNLHIYMDKDDDERLKNPNENTIWELPFVIESCQIDHYLKPNEMLKFGSIEFKVLKTPGHSAGSVAYVCEKARAVFSGDTLFRESIGRTDFEDGDYAAIQDSVLNKLYKLPDDFKIYPGHGPETEVGYEKRNNMYLRTYK